jgi:hypothetical protein
MVELLLLLLLCSPEKILHVAMVLAALMMRHRCFAKTLDIFLSLPHNPEASKVVPNAISCGTPPEVTPNTLGNFSECFR